MVMVTINIPKEINKGIELFKAEHELKDKREAINLLLKRCMAKNRLGADEQAFKKLFREADKTRAHNLLPEQIKNMDCDIYE
jgi:hypothetical protein